MPEEENGKTENDSGVFAVCLKCGNRWKVRKLDVKKRKCLVCGSYRTALESEAYSQNSMVEEEEKTENRDGMGENAEGFDSAIPSYSGYSTGENNGYSAEKLENSVEKEKNRIEKAEKKKRKKQEKKPRRKIDDEIIELDDEAIDELIEDEDGKAKKEKKKEKKSRSWILWIAAAVFIFGLLYWFLSSLGKKKGRKAPEEPEQQEQSDFGGAIPGLV